MTIKHSDTHPEAAAVQWELLRRATVARRASLMRSMTRTAVASSRRALERAHPELDQRGLDLLFVELNYGRELAGRVQQWLGS